MPNTYPQRVTFVGAQTGVVAVKVVEDASTVKVTGRVLSVTVVKVCSDAVTFAGGGAAASSVQASAMVSVARSAARVKRRDALSMPCRAKAGVRSTLTHAASPGARAHPPSACPGGAANDVPLVELKPSRKVVVALCCCAKQLALSCSALLKLSTL